MARKQGRSRELAWEAKRAAKLRHGFLAWDGLLYKIPRLKERGGATRPAASGAIRAVQLFFSETVIVPERARRARDGCEDGRAGAAPTAGAARGGRDKGGQGGTLFALATRSTWGPKAGETMATSGLEVEL